jgi:hypothetical protein
MADVHLSWLAVFCFAALLSLLGVSTSSPTVPSGDECRAQLKHTLSAQTGVDAGDSQGTGRCRPNMQSRSGAGAAEAGGATRLQQAFRAADDVQLDETRLEALRAAARKSDRLDGSAACGLQTWPYLSWRCFVRQVDGRPQPVRTVTVERQKGERGSALVRLPAEQLSARH